MRENDELKIRNTMLERANQLHEGQFGHDAVATEETTNPAKRRKTASAGRKSTRAKAVQLADATAETSLEDDLNLIEDHEGESYLWTKKGKGDNKDCQMVCWS